MSDSGSGSRIHLGYVTLLAATASLGGFLFGFDSAVINGAVPGIQAAFQSGSLGTGFQVASILLGCAVGAVIAGKLADRLGRRATMILTAILFAVTAAAAGLARTDALFSLTRFLSGIAVGAASVVSPAYIAEVSPPRVRGRLASLQQLGIVLGIFVSLLCDHLIANAAGGVSEHFWLGLEAWRWMFLIEIVPSAVFAFASLIVPESPRHLVAIGRSPEALAVLRRIQPDVGEDEVREIEKTLAGDHRPRLSDLRGSSGAILPVVWVGIGLSVLQQLVGINVVFYYGTVLWQAVGFTTADSLRINVVTGIVNIASTLVAMALIDRVGRKPLLLWGSIGMSVALAVVVFVFATGSAGASGAVALGPGRGVVALVAANFYVFAFGLSWGPCVWVLLGEMFSNRIRGAALAVAVFAQWMANWLVTVSFPPALSSLGPGPAYSVYLFFALVSIVFVTRRVPETRGRALEQM